MTKTKKYYCTQTACEDNHNLYKLELLWKDRMTLPLWNLLPEHIFLKICKHVDSSFEEPTFEQIKYNDIPNITYEVQKFDDRWCNSVTPMTYEDLLMLRSLSLTTNTDTLRPTEIIKPLTEDLHTIYEQYRNNQEKMKDDFLPKPEAKPYELMRLTYDDPYLKKIFV
jgi:hypothetical protein